MNIQNITFGSGCFWCTEAIFQSVKGVVSVKSGYMGGTVKYPTYMEISNGNTGHAEVVQVEFDGDIVSLDELLLFFFKTHNPTSLNRQGGDIGTQYRSVIFYHDDRQKRAAEAMMKRLADEQLFDKPILTEISPASEFYQADNHNQNYYITNPLKPYCTVVIHPKLNKFVKEFTDKIKPELL
ncbi:peptide-methionine (S)-S-oxide reductase MsrA [Mucilaginibacter achroorhodeus]|uniref:Peptide methionine sulfoxide reductase MsrA n=1 Tax=Mucilaginibacter achroorhodeus TaxID=2599294 RepID=A0A563TYN7_9SPHI|nr:MULTISPECIES: peptide-methionine (S)-S-oxide reductase MsrA [Mucilaginibacter]QXV65418.1 peptide-methionine (S)-S-oxide reductase MsrA [Mucilaginibacter sp. 21P]TWR24474.1 peptide-methionine (S)-S-oxide reductase MsrA [Mucilaginibacter achroorhodeus]